MDTHDFLERAWQNAQEAVRDYEMYSKKINNDEISNIFKQFAEEEGYHASKFRELLLKYKEDSANSDNN